MHKSSLHPLWPNYVYKMLSHPLPLQDLDKSLMGYKMAGDRCLTGREIKCRCPGPCAG